MIGNINEDVFFKDIVRKKPRFSESQKQKIRSKYDALIMQYVGLCEVSYDCGMVDEYGLKNDRYDSIKTEMNQLSYKISLMESKYPFLENYEL